MGRLSERPLDELEREDEEQVEILCMIQDARDRGDEQEMLRLQKRLKPTAETLLSAKMRAGADWVREQGYDTCYADAFFGPGWLERSNEELLAILDKARFG